ncbi:hypothetical protein KR054_002272 [Drosophila jambulina]|nr:hypothetical protein KR054_002272 [Drosophila jambulina]
MSCSVILMLVPFVVLLYIQNTQAQLLEPGCGLTGITDYIMHGTNAIHGANPWMAYLYLRENDFQCGGSLIHKLHFGTEIFSLHVNNSYRPRTVRLGEYFSPYRASSSAVYEVVLAMRNRRFDDYAVQHDIGMLKLDREVVFNGGLTLTYGPFSVFLTSLSPTDYIRPICIFTDPSQAPSVSSYTVTGWGTTETQRVAERLQRLNLQEEAPGKCYNNLGGYLNPGQICASNPTGDTCLGDSGSPLGQYVNINGLMRYTQFGLVSYGSRRCNGPAIYTRVAFYVDWIVRAVEYGLRHKQKQL